MREEQVVGMEVVQMLSFTAKVRSCSGRSPCTGTPSVVGDPSSCVKTSALTVESLTESCRRAFVEIS